MFSVLSVVAPTFSLVNQRPRAKCAGRMQFRYVGGLGARRAAETLSIEIKIAPRSPPGTRAALTLTASHAHSRTLVRRAADGHGRAGIQAVVAFLTIASSFCSFAPVTVSRSFPSWYTWNVGIAITPFSCDTSSSSSTSTCARHVRSPSSGGAGRAERQTAEARGPLRRGCWLRTCPPASRRTGRSFGRDHTRSPCNRQPWSPRRSALARLPRPSQPQCVVLPQHLYPLSARWSRPSAPQ